MGLRRRQLRSRCVTVAGGHCRQDRIGRARENTMAAAGGEKQAKKDANKRRYDPAAVGGDACQR
jgi:hypothetical protein